jgi:hypothetical protein
MSLLEDIVAGGTLLAVQSLLLKLASLAVCKRFHQNQAIRLSQDWALALSCLKGIDDSYNPAETILSMEKASASIAAQAVIVPYNYNRTNAKTETISVKIEEVEDDPRYKLNVKGHRLVQTPPRLAQPNRDQSGLDVAKKKESPRHNFTPFGKPKNIYELNVHIKKVLEGDLLPKTELPQAAGGYIYMFTFPDTYRDPSPHIKIGYSKNLDDRMARWNRQCGYKPRVLNHFNVELYVRVEKLVHANLYNERMRESEGCPECNTRHHEWFRVRLSKAAGIAGLWSDWSRLEPFDNDGVLKRKWRKRLELVDLYDPDCWDKFVNDDFDLKDDVYAKGDVYVKDEEVDGDAFAARYSARGSVGVRHRR